MSRTQFIAESVISGIKAAGFGASFFYAWGNILNAMGGLPEKAKSTVVNTGALLAAGVQTKFIYNNIYKSAQK